MHHALVLPSRNKGTPLVLMGDMLAGGLAAFAAGALPPAAFAAGGSAPGIFMICQSDSLAEAPAVEHLQGCLE